VNIYRSVVRPVLFSGLKADPEWLHQQTLHTLGWLDHHHKEPSARWLQQQVGKSYCLADDRLEQQLWGLHFQNPIGLAAGFDKDGVASGVWSSFGFGFAELGTVTAIAQPGNPQPRLFRLPLDHAALNRMGFNNRWAAAMAATLQQRWGQGRGERGKQRKGSKGQ
jgi:dihydroorotate dehydrogenase